MKSSKPQMIQNFIKYKSQFYNRKLNREKKNITDLYNYRTNR